MSSAEPSNTVIADDWSKVVMPSVEQLYGYTSSTTGEYVAGTIGMRNSADQSVKWWATGNKATCVILDARYHPGLDSDGVQNSDYAVNAKPIRVAVGGFFKYMAAVKTGMTIVRGDLLVPETATGKLIKLGTSGQSGPIVAVALESVTTAATPTKVKVLNLIGNMNSSVMPYEETLTVTTNVATMSKTCLFPIAVHQYATTTTGAASISTVAASLTLMCLYTASGGTLTFYAGDAVTQCKVLYMAML